MLVLLIDGLYGFMGEASRSTAGEDPDTMTNFCGERPDSDNGQC